MCWRDTARCAGGHLLMKFHHLRFASVSVWRSTHATTTLTRMWQHELYIRHIGRETKTRSRMVGRPGRSVGSQSVLVQSPPLLLHHWDPPRRWWMPPATDAECQRHMLRRTFVMQQRQRVGSVERARRMVDGADVRIANPYPRYFIVSDRRRRNSRRSIVKLNARITSLLRLADRLHHAGTASIQRCSSLDESLLLSATKL